MTLPVFTAAPTPVVDEGKFGTHVDYKARPACRLCPEDGPVDASGLGVGCWRIVVLAPAVARGETLTASGADTPVMYVPSDDVARARELPRLTDTSGPTGVVVDVVLSPPPSKPVPPRRKT